ncbi:hypothetical protein [Streptomyces sp. NPDC000618]|uniref:hypothetical protein n=1 Tax=Streptomyces sp. NPDC000618 TaxID=3154265 RepID=UPI00331F8456
MTASIVGVGKKIEFPAFCEMASFNEVTAWTTGLSGIYVKMDLKRHTWSRSESAGRLIHTVWVSVSFCLFWYGARVKIPNYKDPRVTALAMMNGSFYEM